MSELQESSGFRRYCVGIVAINKKLHENTIEVMPIERQVFADKDLTDKWEEITAVGYDSDNNRYENKSKYTRTITCKWLALHQNNRLTSPDVRRGDKVQVYRMGDANTFYWDTIDNFGRTKRLETVVYGYSATKIEDEELDTENTYVQGVSTHERMVTLIHTSKHPSNKEKYKYAIFVDTKNNHVVIKDDQENRILLKTEESLIRLENKNNTYIQIDGDRITSKGSWYHKGTFSADKDVFASKVSLKNHTHPETQAITKEPIPSGMPWSPCDDKLKVDYRNPELVK